jgi:hypothetical protein
MRGLTATARPVKAGAGALAAVRGSEEEGERPRHGRPGTTPNPASRLGESLGEAARRPDLDARDERCRCGCRAGSSRRRWPGPTRRRWHVCSHHGHRTVVQPVRVPPAPRSTKRMAVVPWASAPYRSRARGGQLIRSSPRLSHADAGAKSGRGGLLSWTSTDCAGPAFSDCCFAWAKEESARGRSARSDVVRGESLRGAAGDGRIWAPGGVRSEDPLTACESDGRRLALVPPMLRAVRASLERESARGCGRLCGTPLRSRAAVVC